MKIADTVMKAWADVLAPMFDDLATDVWVALFDQTTEKDEVYDEPTARKHYLAPVAVKARVKLGKDRLILPGGEAKDVDGHMTFKTRELEEKAVLLEFGAKVIFKGEEYVIVHLEKRAGVGKEFLLTRAYVQGV